MLIVLVVLVAVVYGGVKIIKKSLNLPKVQLLTTSNPAVTTIPTEKSESNLEEPSSQPVLAENFDKTGNLTDWDANSEKETGLWVFLYEAPSNPAITVNLVFNTSSRCDLGNGEEVCDQNKLELGSRARVQGNIKSGVVTVIKLTKLAGP